MSANEETLAHVQAGTIASLAAFAEALIASGAVSPEVLIQSLERWSGAAARSEIGKPGQLMIDGLLMRLREIEKTQTNLDDGSQ